MERIDKGWTIITDDGLQMWADGIFTEAEAREHVKQYPLTPNGRTRQYAVPNHIAKRAAEERARIGREAERVMDEARREAVSQLFTEQW